MLLNFAIYFRGCCLSNFEFEIYDIWIMKTKELLHDYMWHLPWNFLGFWKNKNTCKFSLRVLVNGYWSTFEMQLKLNENLMHEEHTFIWEFYYCFQSSLNGKPQNTISKADNCGLLLHARWIIIKTCSIFLIKANAFYIPQFGIVLNTIRVA